MARVNITVPDDVIARARAARLNVSRLATSALEEALERMIKLQELDDYLAWLEAQVPSPTPEQEAEAERLAGEIEDATRPRKRAHPRRRTSA